MIEYLEADLNGAPIDALNTEYAVVTEQANEYEAINEVANASNETKIDLKRMKDRSIYRDNEH